jgi:FMN phosphatase YigB (HAD superfamily)
LEKYFDDKIILSYEIGFAKDNENLAMLNAVERLFNVPANEIIFIDDRIENITKALKKNLYLYIFHIIIMRVIII